MHIFRSIYYWESSDTYKFRSTFYVHVIFHIVQPEREILLYALDSIGLNKSKGLHSLRSGGATAAAEAGVEDRLLGNHGRWKSEKTYDSYVKESINQIICI